VYAAQIDFGALLAARPTTILYQPLPKFPAVERDIAVVCDKEIPVSRLEDCIRRGGKGLVREIELFDIYTGKPIPEDKKSVAFALKLRHDDRTLTDVEADEDVKNVLTLLEQELKAVLR
jgi:phenylalanyl-tRNA synthetase beta chain